MTNKALVVSFVVVGALGALAGCAGKIRPGDLQHLEVHFNTGETLPMSTSGFFMLGRAAELLNQDPEAKLLVVGHTDAVGTPEKNKELALNRAHHVREFIGQLVPKVDSRIRIAFYGEDRPRYDNSTAEGRAANRRVELFFYRSKGDDDAQLQSAYEGKLVFSGKASGSVGAGQ